jgi:hypothetical protein
MKRLTIWIPILIAALAINVASAQGTLPGSGWWTGEQVQNVGTATAQVAITIYDKNTSNTWRADREIAPGASYTFTPFDPELSSSATQGSAIVSADQPIRAIVNVTNIKAGPLGQDGGKAAAQYQGFDASATANTLLFPLVKGDYYGHTTSFYVQNAGNAAATAQAVFKMRTGAVYTYTTPSIGPGQMVVFSIYDAGYTPPTNPDGRVGSLIVASTQPLAGVSLEHKTVENPATLLQGTRGFTPADYDSKAYAPVIKHQWYGRFTGIQVQNPNTIDITVTVTYKGTGGACRGNTYTESHAVPAGGAYTFVQFAGYTPLPSPCLASATIEGTGDFVALVNEGALPGYPPAGITYSAIPNKVATTKVSAPLFKDNYYNNTSGLQIQNVGTVRATNVVATFNCTTRGGSSFIAVSKPQTIDPGAAYLFFRPSTTPSVFTTSNPFVSDQANCAVTVTSDQPIVAIVNEMGWGISMDDNNYEGFNLTP